MTFAQQLEQRGLEKGLEQGMYHTKREAVQKMVAKGIDYPLIQDILNLSDEKIKDFL